MSRESRSTGTFTLEPPRADEFEPVLRLLSDENLPVADLASHIEAFTLAKCGETIVGAVGVEIYGAVALLRSLCVAPSHRGQRIGEALVSAVESRAAAHGVRELFLLTTAAAPYFANLGFAPLARDQVPIEIRNTAQFSALCPASAVCMRKAVGASPESGPS